MICVAREHEGTSNDVMREHLIIVFPFFLDIEDKDLLQPKCELSEVVPFERPAEFAQRPVGPHLGEIQPVRTVIHEVLQKT